MIQEKYICQTTDISPKKPYIFNVKNNEQIVIFQVEQKYYAVENRCPHAGGLLHEGIKEGQILTCIWHGWQFDLESGQSIDKYWARIKTYGLNVRNNEVYLLLDG
jgi:nitrite reductase/ring-hydroxylating ferredoxin subunit